MIAEKDKILKSMFAIICLFMSISFISGQETTSISEFDQAKQANKHILLVFSGSDWCLPCMRFKKEVLDNDRFRRATTSDFVIINADFPQRGKLSKDVVMRNEYLAEKYNPKGSFPLVLLLTPDLSRATVLEYAHFDPDLFVKRLLSKSREYSHVTYNRKAKLMGCDFEFTIVDSINSIRATALLDAAIEEVSRIEDRISEWKESSEVSLINSNGGIAPVRVSPEVYDLINRSKILSKLTQGAFDISFLKLMDLWKFEKQTINPPSQQKIQEMLNMVGYQKISLRDSGYVFLERPGMKIGFGGVGKGYAADMVKKKLQAVGIADGVINASGDLVAWGKPPESEYWKIAIADPSDPDRIICWIPINDGAVATSGDYEKYLMMNGKRYAHIIDPKTGYPTSGITSATVISSSAELSDALATAIIVLGIENGMNLIEQLPNAECLIIDDQMKLYFSSNLNYIQNKT